MDLLRAEKLLQIEKSTKTVLGCLDFRVRTDVPTVQWWYQSQTDERTHH